ncbi:protein of unknown function [Methylacidimicrobium sp. AP8]|nr:protein of unknown function [Methylacidimicrobium sp. AP8]
MSRIPGSVAKTRAGGHTDRGLHPYPSSDEERLGFFVLFPALLPLAHQLGLLRLLRRGSFFGLRGRNREENLVLRVEKFDAGRRSDVADVDRLAYVERFDIHRDRLRKIVGQAADAQVADRRLQQTSAGPNANRFSNRVKLNLGVDLLIGGELVQVDVEDAIGQRVLLDRLQERELLLLALLAFDLQIDQHFFRLPSVKGREEIHGVDFERHMALPSVEHGGDFSFRPQSAHPMSSDRRALSRLERYCTRHSWWTSDSIQKRKP